MKYLNRKQKNLLLINQGHYIGNVYRGNTVITPELLADFKHMVARVIETMMVPDSVIVQPMELPAGMVYHGGNSIAITATTRKLAVKPHGDDHAEWIVHQLEKMLQADYERAVLAHGDDLLYFYCPYTPVVYMGMLAGDLGCHCFATRYGYKATTRDFKHHETVQSCSFHDMMGQ